jgi:hypothetical protein
MFSACDNGDNETPAARGYSGSCHRRMSALRSPSLIRCLTRRICRRDAGYRQAYYRQIGDYDHDYAKGPFDRCGRCDSFSSWYRTFSRVRLSVLQEGGSWAGRLPIRYLRAVLGCCLRYGGLLSTEFLAFSGRSRRCAGASAPRSALLTRIVRFAGLPAGKILGTRDTDICHAPRGALS